MRPMTVQAHTNRNTYCTLNALLVSAGMAIAAPVICSCITLD